MNTCKIYFLAKDNAEDEESSEEEDTDTENGKLYKFIFLRFILIFLF